MYVSLHGASFNCRERPKDRGKFECNVRNSISWNNNNHLYLFKEYIQWESPLITFTDTLSLVDDI